MGLALSMNNMNATLATAKAAALAEFKTRYWPGAPEISKHWKDVATSPTAITVNSQGAAILPKGDHGHGLNISSGLTASPNAAQSIRRIADVLPGRAPEYCRQLVRDIVFWGMHSTDGRWDHKHECWTRWGVMSAEDWAVRGKGHTVPLRTFHRIKDKLVEQGLIETKQARHGTGGTRNLLWIRPTERLLEIIYDWEDVPKATAPTKPKGKAPRGISALHAKIDAESRTLFKLVTSSENSTLDDKEKLQIWNRLTKPTSVSAKVIKHPFVLAGTSQWRKLAKALGYELGHTPE